MLREGKEESTHHSEALEFCIPDPSLHQVSGLRKSMNTTKGPCGCCPVVIRRGGVL